MRLSVEAFRNCRNKNITLLGMSGVGKTRLANILRAENWYHYSVDYRIGTRYLDEEILDNIKRQAMQVPFLRELLLSDSIYISNNITFDHERHERNQDPDHNLDSHRSWKAEEPLLHAYIAS